MGEPVGGVRSFQIDRIRMLTGSGVTLTWGPYRFVLLNRDGTPERSLDDAGFQRVLSALIMRVETTPSFSPKEGTA